MRVLFQNKLLVEVILNTISWLVFDKLPKIYTIPVKVRNWVSEGSFGYTMAKVEP